jgi:hypothetical protein
VAEFSIWPGDGGPFPFSADEDAPVSLGSRFVISEPVDLVALRFWRGAAGVGGPVVAAVYAVTGPATGEQLAGTLVAFDAVAIGWERAELPAAVPLAPGSYKAVAHFPSGYTAIGGYWATGAGVGGVTNGPLSAPDASVEGGQGTFAPGAVLTYPTGFFNGGGYPVDVVVSDGDSGPLPDTSAWQLAARPHPPRFAGEPALPRYRSRPTHPRFGAEHA